MTSVIKIKRSEVSGNPAVLGAGELAYSALTDNGSNGGDRLYIGMGTETAGNAVNHVVIGGKYFTDQITAATSSNTANTIVRRNADGDFTAGIITAALSGNAATATKWATARNLSLTGDATATLASIDGSAAVSAAITLATVNSDVGSFGSGTAIPVLTVNAKGLITGVTTAAISTSFNVYGNSGVTAVGGGGSFEIVGGTGVTTNASGGPRVTIDIGQAVGPTDNVTFNNVAVNGTLSSDDITAANISVAGNATITGNLTVQGTTTTINSTTIAVGDINIVLAKDATDATGANGAGLTVNGPATAATITYTSTDDRWNLNKDLNVATVYGALSGNASTATTLQTARTINGVSFNGSSNITITANTTNTLTIGSGLSGTSFNGSSAVTVAVDSTIARRADTFYLGTTVLNLNRTSSPTALTGINGIELVGDSSGATTLRAPTDGNSNQILTLPNHTGTLISNADTGTVTSQMLSGGIENSKLINSTITIGTTSIALGSSNTALTGLGSVESTYFTGALTGNASTASKLASAKTISASGDASFGFSFDGSANASFSVLLATVNSNVGSFGSGISVPNFTVNAKGLITAASSTAIPTATTSVLGLSKFDTDNFTVTSGLVSISTIDGGTY